MRYVLLVQYDGTFFAGYQRQKRGERTVQGELERAAEEVFGVPTRVAASGRTDAGVHALAQVCHLDGETTVPFERLAACLNTKLPPDCKVLCAAPAPEGFDCTRSVKQKTYRYRAYVAPTALPLFARYAARLERAPDLGRMREAAALLKGEHDFAAFSSTGSSAKTTVRTLYSVEVACRTENGATMYEIEVTGSGFLYHMVRILAGEIFAVGYGKSTENLQRAFATKQRNLIAKTMPAAGLTLVRVEYQMPLFAAKED